MRNLTFRGHAQRKGFSALKVPDTSNRILQQAEQNLQGMRNVQKATIDQRNEMLRSMKETANKEEIIRNKSFKLETEFAEAYRNAELRNIQTEIDDAKRMENFARVKAQKEQAAREQLKALIPQTFKAFQQFDQQRWTNAHKKAKEIQGRFGLTVEEASHAWKVERTAEAVESGTSRLLKSNGGRFSPEQALAISKISGYEVLATQQLAAGQYGREAYPTWFWDNAEKKVPGLNRSVNEILRDETGVNSGELSQAIRHWETEFISLEKTDKEGNPVLGEDGKPQTVLGSYSDPFVTEHVRPHMHKFRESLMAEQHVRDQSAVKTRSWNKKVNTLKAKIKHPNGTIGENFVKWYLTNAGDDPEAIADSRAEGIKILKSMADTGELKRSEWNQILDYRVDRGEANPEKRQRWGTLYKDEIREVEKAFHEREKKENQVRKEKETTASEQMRMRTVTLTQQLKRPLNFHEIKEIRTFVQAQPGWNMQGPKWKWLTDYENTDQLAINHSKTLLDGRVAQGTLTMAELYGRPVYHPSHYKDYEKLTIDGPNAISSESRSELIGSVKAAVASKLETVIKTGDERGAQTRQMSGIAVELLQNNVKNALINEQYKTSLDAWNGESTKLIQRIEAGTGLFKLNTDASGEEVLGKAGAGFEYLSKVRTQEKASAVRLKAEADKNIINTKGWLEDSQIEAIKSTNPILGKQVGGIPSFVWELDRVYPNKDPYEIMNTILVNHGEKEIIPPGGAKVSRFVHPSVKQLVTDSCSLSRTCRAVVETVEKTNPKEDPVKVITDVTKSKASSIDEQHDGADTITSPHARTGNGLDTGSASFNKPINELPAEGIMDLWRQGRINTFGAWLHDGPTLQRHIDEGYVDPTQPLDIDVQRGIEIREIWDQSGNFRVPETQEVIWGVGQSWVVTPPLVPAVAWEETANLFAMKGPWRTFQFRDDLKPFIGGMLSGK